MARDSQRQRLYDAENIVRRQMDFAAKGARAVSLHGSTITLPLEVRFGTVEAAQAYLDQIMGTDWFRQAFPRTRIPVRIRRRKTDHHAHYEAPDTIAVHYDDDEHGWAMRETVLLHELAHHVTHLQYMGDVVSHGPEFAGIFQHLVAQAIGPEVGLLMMSAYADHGVKWEVV